jgi:hypothetical protein
MVDVVLITTDATVPLVRKRSLRSGKTRTEKKPESTVEGTAKRKGKSRGMASVDDSLKQITLIPPQNYEPIEDKALENLKRVWPEIVDDVVMFLGLEKAMQRHAEVSREQAS